MPDPGHVKHGPKKTRNEGATTLSIDLGTDNAPPTEFRMFKAGENPSEKGMFLFTPESALSVMNEYAKHGKTLRFDFNHGTLLEGVDPEVSKSAGSFSLEVRDGELWATQCNWTDYAAQKITSREYGDFSPYFNHDKNGVITRVINCALTNLPALDDIEPLVAASATHTDEDHMACEACTALTAQLTAATARANSMDEECKALKARLSLFEKKDDEEKTKATALTALTGKQSHAETLGVINGWKLKAEAHDKLAADLAERDATALKLEVESIGKQITAALDAGFAEGKVPGKPGETGTVRAELEAATLKMGGGKPSKEGLAFLTALIAGMPKTVKTEQITPPPAAGFNPTVMEAKLSRAMGVDEAEFQKWNAARLTNHPGQ